MDKRGFFYSFGVTYAGTVAAVVLTIAFYGWSLRIGPEAFGALQAAMGMLFLVYASRAVIGSYVVIHAAGDPSSLPAVARMGLRLAFLIGCGIAGALLVAAPFLRDFLHFSTALPFVLMAVSAVPGIVSGAVDGILNVQRRFTSLALSTPLIPAANLAVAIVVLRDGFQDADPGWIVLWGQIAGALNVFLVDRAAFVPTRVRMPFPGGEMWKLFCSALLFGVALRMDVLWARHLLPASEAGTYAIAAAVAIVVHLITSNVGRVTSVSLRGGSGTWIIGWSYGLIVVTSLVLALGFAVAGEPALRFVTGKTVGVDWSVLSPLFVALTCYTLLLLDYTCLNVLTRSVHAGIGAILVCGLGIVLAAFGTSAHSIAWATLGVTGTLAVVFTAVLIATIRRSAPPRPDRAIAHHLGSAT